ncbi:MAG TPA: PhzF family phenazine biosynthesis protein [Nocardioides sp.]|uniref:PhzF family phenazine biosynthesis protein n=1 Tax=Nocardioides sp. TaxID=35761 RepID=UPI002E2F6261|nr:PhzF family phenazine biosynthesis protein [Nocardioides sp.]HEX5087706.1 PhzF family phenazine biosynthesis protein [Nocardioides sp.]
MHTFHQVDVFGSGPLTGNPVAVVHDADGLDDAQMQLFAQWTNLSETTFLLRPTQEGADYRLRIFTASRELPFAGHPTLGSAHAWLESGGTPRGEHLVQECEAGLLTIERGDQLAFKAPPLLREGPVDDGELVAITDALGITPDDVVDARWLDNGPGWVGVLLEDAHDVLELHPDREKLSGLDIGVVAPWRDGGSDAAVEVRAFDSTTEDPVTGSLNAGLGQWLAGTVLPDSYVASQGTAIGRRGRVHVRREGSTVWVGGDTRTTVRGEVSLQD